MVRFNVYLWQGPDRAEWRLRFRNVRQFRLRARLRRLYAEGWGPASILVSRVEE